MYMSFTDLHKAQKLPLRDKICTAIDAIEAGFEASCMKQSIAFSGGKDSTVLWHLIRSNFPDRLPYVILGNTGCEFPESLKFARELGGLWGGDRFIEAKPGITEKEGLKYAAQREVLEWLIASGEVEKVLKENGRLKSTGTLENAATEQMWEDFRRRNLVFKKGTSKSFLWCADQYGYPILGKSASKLDARRINVDCFLKFSKSQSEDEKLLKYYEMLKDVKISQHCCTALKKEPSELEQARLGVDVIFKGLLASESRTRMLSFCVRGYLFESTRPHTEKFYHCNPLGIWTDADIWEYIHTYNVPYSPLYDITYKGVSGKICKIQRNGCMACATDISYKNNHIAVLRQTHPTAYNAIIKRWGLGNELMKLKKVSGNGKLSMLDVFDDAENLLDIRPCAFDDLGSQIVDQTQEYDPENW